VTEQQTEKQGESSYIGRLLTAVTVASILGLAPKTVHKLAREKKLACVQVTSRDRRFTPEQVQDYIRSQSTEVRVDKGTPGPYNRPPRKGVRNQLGILGRIS